MSLKNMLGFSKKEEVKENTSQEGAQEDSAEKIYYEKHVEQEEQPDPSKTCVEDLFPLGAPHYEGTASKDDHIHMYFHKTVCPVCGDAINFPVVAITQLRMVHTDDDMRKHYEDFEPLWYDICNCPNCYYTAPYSSFETTKDLDFYASAIIQAMQPYKDAGVLSFSDPRTINEVLTSYYLALRCSDFYEDEYTVKSKVWLRLSWLYHDLNDMDNYRKATQNAFKFYRLMHYHQRKDIEPVLSQITYLVMASLAEKLKDYRNAYDYLIQAKSIKDGKRIYMQSAQNRLADLRESMREEKAAAEEQ